MGLFGNSCLCLLAELLLGIDEPFAPFIDFFVGSVLQQNMGLDVILQLNLQDVLHLLEEVDDKIIINIMPTENFVGGFYRKPLE